MSEIERLYHYTCDHGAKGIKRDGVIRPNANPLMPLPLVWLTSMQYPDRNGLGLTSHLLKCDRTTWRVSVLTEMAEPWHVFARRYRIGRALRDHLEKDRMPMSWFVALDPVPVDKHAVQLATQP